MQMKGGSSIPAWLAVTVIAVAISVGLILLFTFSTKTNLEVAFEKSIKNVGDTACAVTSPLGGFLCPTAN